MKMKKRIVLMALLLAVAAVSSVFAQNGRNISCSYNVGPDITINSVEQTLVGLNVNYSANKAVGSVRFNFTSYDENGNVWKEWSNEEAIVTARDSSTFRFTHTSPSKISKLYITTERFAVTGFNKLDWTRYTGNQGQVW
jgi:hypothetical protein